MNKSAAYRRIKQDKEFIYLDSDDREVSDEKLIEYFNSLVIPPAWRDVLISRFKGARVLACGIDSAGREQAIYHPKFRARQDKLKFDRLQRFGLALPKLRRQLERDLARKRLGRDKVLAALVSLIDQTYLRVGNDKYAREHESYGVTTLRSKHTGVSGDTVTFEFSGKSGQLQQKQITDSQIARIIKRLDELPGYEIFRYQDLRGAMHDLHASDVNAYIKAHMGEEFTAKDFRTWGGTLTAAVELASCKRPESEKDRAKTITRAVKTVAAELGNTAAVARSSYIDPRILDTYMNTDKLSKVRQNTDLYPPRRRLSQGEQYLINLLDKLD